MAIRKYIILLLSVLLSLSVTAQTDENAQPFYLLDTPYQQPEQVDVNTGISLDSIFPPREIQPLVMRPSLFRHTTLPVTNDSLMERPSTAPSPWLFAALLIFIALLFLYYNNHKLRIIDLLKAAADHRAMDRLVSGNNLNTANTMPMGILAIVGISTSIYLMFLSQYGFLIWLLLIAAISICYLLCNAMTRLFGNVFDDSAAISACLTSNYIYHLLIATAIAPLLLLQTYLPIGRDIVFYIIASLAAVEFVIRIFRSIKLFLTLSKSRSFYLFYYFCAIEIIPISVLIKWLLTQ